MPKGIVDKEINASYVKSLFDFKSFIIPVIVVRIVSLNTIVLPINSDAGMFGKYCCALLSVNTS